MLLITVLTATDYMRLCVNFLCCCSFLFLPFIELLWFPFLISFSEFLYVRVLYSSIESKVSVRAGVNCWLFVWLEFTTTHRFAQHNRRNCAPCKGGDWNINCSGFEFSQETSPLSNRTSKQFLKKQQLRLPIKTCSNFSYDIDGISGPKFELRTLVLRKELERLTRISKHWKEWFYLSTQTILVYYSNECI